MRAALAFAAALSASCSGGADTDTGLDIVDDCIGVVVIDDVAVPAATFDELNVGFSGCRRDETSITCRADVASVDACERERLPTAEAIVARTAPTAEVGCTGLCEVE